MSLREQFEAWYVTHAFDYERNPLGSKDCAMQWDGWQAGHAAARAEAEALLQQVARIPHVREVLMWDKHKDLLAQIDAYLKGDSNG
jgi:hypothetical protein